MGAVSATADPNTTKQYLSGGMEVRGERETQERESEFNCWCIDQLKAGELSGDTPIAPPIMAPTPDRDRGHSSLIAILGLAPIPVADPVVGMLGSCGHNG